MSVFNILDTNNVNLRSLNAYLDSHPNAATEENENRSVILHFAVSRNVPAEITSRIIRLNPDALKHRNTSGNLPLHSAVLGQPAQGVIHLILDEYPEAVKVANEGGNFPLHSALKAKVSSDIILKILQLYPEAAKEKDKAGNYPIFLAFDGGWVSQDVIIALLEVFPDAAKETRKICSAFNNFETLLHVAGQDYKKGGNPETFIRLIRAYPEALSKQIFTKDFPFIYAIEHGADLAFVESILSSFPEVSKIGDPLSAAIKKSSADVVLAIFRHNPALVKKYEAELYVPILIDTIKYKLYTVSLEICRAYPKEAGRKDSYKMYPLNYAVIFNGGAPQNLIMELVKAFPNAVKTCNNFQGESNLPFHSVLQAGEPTPDLVAAFLNADPSLMTIKSANGDPPLFCALQNPKITLETVNALLLANPASVQERNQDGDLPYIYAVDHNVQDSIVTVLLKANPDAVKDRDYAVHYALNKMAKLETVCELLRNHPTSVTERNNEGNLPLHIALSNKLPNDIITTILRANPNAAQDADKDGILPLHYVAVHGIDIDLLSVLINAYPFGTQIKNKDGHLPLDTVIENKKFEMIRALVVAYPDSIQNYKKDGDPILHHLLRNEAKADAILAVIEYFPAAAKITDGREILPLHIAIADNPVKEIISTLLSQYPEAASVRSKRILLRELPLHYILKQMASKAKDPDMLDNFQSLIKHCPEAVKENFVDGSSPVNFVLKNEKNELQAVTILTSLLKAYPDGARQEDQDGELPLHCAISSSRDLSMIKLLLEAFPDAVRRKLKNKEDYPLHVLLRKKFSRDVIVAVLLTCPNVAKDPFKNGDFPLHFALLNNFDVQVIIELIKAYPAAIKSRNNQGRSAMNILSTMKYLEEVVMSDLPIESSDTSRTSKRGTAWAALLDPEYCPVDIALPIMKRVFEQHRNAAKDLAFCQDESGRRAFDVADQNMKLAMNQYLLFCGRFRVDGGFPLHKSATSSVLLADDFYILQIYRQIFDEHAQAHASQSADKVLTEISFKDAIKALRISMDMLTADFQDNRQLDESISHEFAVANRSRDSLVNWNDFETYCRAIFGETRRVVLKLMKNFDQYSREKSSRRNDLDSKTVIELLPEPDLDVLAADISSLNRSLGHGVTLTFEEYRYCLVMPAADRNLDSILRFESPSIGLRLGYVEDVIDCLLSMHSRGLMHGDIKALNIVRLNGRMRLIDLDASGVMRDDFAGSKFSSGVLPPEMFCKLDEKKLDQYKEYWRDKIDIDTVDGARAWQKIKPVEDDDGNYYVVKSYATDSQGKPIDREKLPYKLIKASDRIDAWSVGVILYSILSGDNGKGLFKVDNNDDLDEHDFITLATWTQEKITRKLKKQTILFELLDGLLRLDPEERWTLEEAKAYLVSIKMKGNSSNMDLAKTISALVSADFKKILDEKFETQSLLIKEQTNFIIEKTYQVSSIVQQSIQMKIDQSHSSIMRGLIEASDVIVPSCFIIVNQKLSKPGAQNVSESCERAGRWIHQLNALGEFISNMTDQNAIASKAKELFQGQSLYLYLVDEFTMEPTVCENDPIYPIEITTPAEFVPKVLPLLRVGMTAVKAINSLAGLGKFFGFPVPTIPSEYINDAKDFFSHADECSTDDYRNIQRIVDDKNGKQENTLDSATTVRGGPLRELALFLRHHDAKCTFSNLRRVLTLDGKCIWTSDENVQNIDPSIATGTTKEVTTSKNISEVEVNISVEVSSRNDVQRVDKTAESNSTKVSTIISADAITSSQRNYLPLKYSFIERQSKYLKSWERMFFMLEKGSLRYFEGRGHFDSLAGKEVVRKGPKECELLRGSGNTKLLRFETEAECDAWVTALQLHINYSNDVASGTDVGDIHHVFS